VRGDRQQIYLHRIDVDWHFANALRSIDVKNDAAFATQLADRADVLNDTDFVIDASTKPAAYRPASILASGSQCHSQRASDSHWKPLRSSCFSDRDGLCSVWLRRCAVLGLRKLRGLEQCEVVGLSRS
jgi:hypothetical protein